MREAYSEAFPYAVEAYGNKVSAQRLRICANRSGKWAFRENRAHMTGPLLPSKFCHMGYRSEIRYLASVQGPLYPLLLLYHTRAHLSSVILHKNKKKIRGLILGLSWAVETVILTAVATCYIIGRELVGVGTSATTSALAVTDVIVIGVPKGGEVIAFVHRVLKCALARDRTVAVVRTVPTIYGAMDVSHYCSPPIIATISAKASIIAQPISISAFSP